MFCECNGTIFTCDGMFLRCNGEMLTCVCEILPCAVVWVILCNKGDLKA